jgi:hypothetical protein
VDFSAMFFLDTKGFFDGILIEGIGDAGDALPNQSVRLRVDLHVRGIRNLFDAYRDLHVLLFLFSN